MFYTKIRPNLTRFIRFTVNSKLNPISLINLTLHAKSML